MPIWAWVMAYYPSRNKRLAYIIAVPSLAAGNFMRFPQLLGKSAIAAPWWGVFPSNIIRL
jgi:hypothetical protein